MLLPKENIESFFKRTSFSGLCAVYALTISQEKAIAFNFDDFVKSALPGNEEYCRGFIIACAAFELVYFNIHNGILTVQDTGLLTTIRVKKELLGNFNKLSTDYKNETVLKIEEYFD